MSVPIAGESLFLLDQCLQFCLQRADSFVFILATEFCAEPLLCENEKIGDFSAQVFLLFLLFEEQRNCAVKIIRDAFGYARLGGKFREDATVEIPYDFAEVILLLPNRTFCVRFSFLGDFVLGREFSNAFNRSGDTALNLF